MDFMRRRAKRSSSMSGGSPNAITPAQSSQQLSASTTAGQHGRLNVAVLAVNNLATTSSYFVRLLLDDVEIRTSAIKSTRNPVWNEEFALAVTDLSSDLVLQLVNEEVLGKNVAGEASLSLQEIDANDVTQLSLELERRKKKGIMVKTGQLFVRVQFHPIEDLSKYLPLELLLSEKHHCVLSAINRRIDLLEIDRIAQAILNIYGSRNKLLPILKWMIRKEVDSTDEESLLFRGQNLYIKVITEFTMHLGKDCLREHLGNTLSYLIETEPSDGSNLYEIDPTRLSYPSSSSSGVIDSLNSSSSGADVEPQLKTNLRNLRELLLTLLNKIFSAGPSLPRSIRQLCRYLRETVMPRFPGSKFSVLGGFLFLRFICPCIVTPDAYKISSSSPGLGLRRGLVLSAKVIQCLAIGVTFGDKEGYMSQMNPFIEQMLPRMTEFYERLLLDSNDVPEGSEDASEPSTPKTNSHSNSSPNSHSHSHSHSSSHPLHSRAMAHVLPRQASCDCAAQSDSDISKYFHGNKAVGQSESNGSDGEQRSREQTNSGYQSAPGDSSSPLGSLRPRRKSQSSCVLSASPMKNQIALKYGQDNSIKAQASRHYYIRLHNFVYRKREELLQSLQNHKKSVYRETAESLKKALESMGPPEREITAVEVLGIAELEKIVDKMKHPRTGLHSLMPHKRKSTSWKAYELIDWMLVYVPECENRYEGVLLGSRLVEMQFLKRKILDESNEEGFLDDSTIYDFEEPDKKTPAMNCKRVFKGVARHPCQLAIALLSKIVSIYRSSCALVGFAVTSTMVQTINENMSYKDFLMETEELQAANLELLENTEQKLCFWINIFNTLGLHAYVQFGLPSGLFSKSRFQQKASYMIGNQRFNMLDCEAILRAPLLPPKTFGTLKLHFPYQKIHKRDPRHKFCLDSAEAEPRIIFALNSGHVSSPSINIYYPNSVRQLLADATQEYLAASVSLERVKNEWVVVLPKLLEVYYRDFGVSKKDMVANLPTHLGPDSPNSSHFQDLPKKTKIKFSDFDWDFYYCFSKFTEHLAVKTHLP